MQIDNFEKWVNKIEEPAKKKLNLSSMAPAENKSVQDLNDTQKEERNTHIQNKISEAVQEALKEPITLILDSEPIIKINIIFPTQNNKTFNPYEIQTDRKCNFSTLESSKGDLSVEGAVIDILLINGEGNREIDLNNCCIRKIDILNGRLIKLNLYKCLIGQLHLQKQSINTLSVKEGGIISISCPPPGEDNPFFGSVTFQDVYFPTSKNPSNIFKGPQQYRNMRAHFEALQNSPAASLMRAKELASERETDKGLSKFFNYIYFFVSDYGLSPGRPLRLLLYLYILMAAFIFAFDGAGINTSQKSFEELLPSIKEKAKRSLLIPIQTMVNPAGIFLNNQITSAQTRKGKIIILFLSLTADGLIIFTIAGLRKRFKIH